METQGGIETRTPAVLVKRTIRKLDAAGTREDRARILHTYRAHVAQYRDVVEYVNAVESKIKNNGGTV